MRRPNCTLGEILQRGKVIMRKNLILLTLTLLLITGCNSKQKEDINGNLVYKGDSEKWLVEVKVNYSRSNRIVSVNEETRLKYLGEDLKVGTIVYTEYDAFSGTGKISSKSLLTEGGYVYAGGGGHTGKDFKIPTGQENLIVNIKWDDYEEKINVKVD